MPRTARKCLHLCSMPPATQSVRLSYLGNLNHHWFIHCIFNQHILNICHGPAMGPGVRDSVQNKTILTTRNFHSQWWAEWINWEECWHRSEMWSLLPSRFRSLLSLTWMSTVASHQAILFHLFLWGLFCIKQTGNNAQLLHHIRLEHCSEPLGDFPIQMFRWH
jgi:hypothetical protein